MNKYIVLVFKLTILILIGWLVYYFYPNLIIKNDLLNSLITFLSILFGFYITSLSIFVTSKYVASLYQIEDEKNITRTLLHKLLSDYKIGLTLLLGTIIYLIILTVYAIQCDKGELILHKNYILFFLVPLIVANIFYSYSMLLILIKIILQESKNKKL